MFAVFAHISKRIRHIAAGFAAFCLLPAATAVAQGFLLPVDRALPPLELKRHEQEVKITDQVARTKIRQVFFNPSPVRLEANYLFPVPKGAQVTDFSMLINGARVHGEVLESAKARGIYEDIVRRSADPGLIEYMEDTLLRVRVFPVPARGDQEIELELVQALPADGGLVRYETPLGASPARGRVAAGPPQSISLTIDIECSTPIVTLYSPTHAIDANKSHGNRSASIRIDSEELRKGRDFTLYYSAAKEGVGLSALAYRPDAGDPGYFALFITPGLEREAKNTIPVDVVFVLDTSGSMAEEGKLDQARQALIQCLGGLRRGDRFNILSFATEVEAMSKDFQPSDEESRRRAESYLRDLRPRGGTNIADALQRAIAMGDNNKGSDSERLRVVVFLTDGLPTVGETTPKAILHAVESENTRRLRIFPLGIGYEVNVRLLDDLAEATGAVSDYIRPKENIEQRVTAFFDKIGAPVLTDCRLDIEGIETFDTYPRQIRDLFQGQQVLVFGRYRGDGKAEITLRGRARDKDARFKFTTRFPARDDENKFIETLWGTRKIGYLLDEIRRNGESDELVREVIELAKKYRVVTPWTSYLVTEDQPLAPPIAYPPQPPPPRFPRPPHPRPIPRIYDDRDLYFDQQNNVKAMAPAAREAGVGVDAAGAAWPQGTPAPLSAPQQSQGRILASAKGQLNSGEEAVNLGIEVQRLRSAGLSDVDSNAGRIAVNEAAAASSERKAAGRTFIAMGSAWVDSGLINPPANSTSGASGITPDAAAKTVAIRFGSAAYFELLSLRPDLKEALMLGNQVRLRLANGTALEIAPNAGLETLDDASRALLRR